MLDEIGEYATPTNSPFPTNTSVHDASIRGIASDNAMQFHGRNYIVGDESMIGWTFSQREENIATIVSVPTVPQQNVNPGDRIEGKELTGLAAASARIASRFGIRPVQMPPVITKGLGSKVLATLLAKTYIRKLNAAIDSCELTFNMRPDFQLARTIYLLDRRKLYYITGIQQHLQWGESFVTQVQGSYGHNVFSPILDPWRQAVVGKPDTSQDVFSELIPEQVTSLDDLQETLNSGGAQ
jgi:hypothetical protein